MASRMKVAVVHDYLAQAGGAERVAATLHSLFPAASLFTSVYDAKATLAYFQDIPITTSFLQRWPLSSQCMHKLALPLYPTAFEHFDFRGCDLVLSSSSSFAKGVITPPETCHVCYCHTPARFAWRQREYLSQSRRGRLMSLLLGGVLGRLRSWDIESAQRPDYYVANSYNVAQRIRKYYRRDVAAVIPPPIETEHYSPISPREVGNHFLVVSRLVGYKRIDLAVEACNRLQVPLRVVGTGPDMAGLKRLAGPTITFSGRLTDQEVADEYARCRALIVPGEEDFGMTPLECMASGRPVVAFAAGGALETVIDGQTGLLFQSQTADSLAAALMTVSNTEFAPEVLQRYAARFGVSVFKDRMTRFLEGAWDQHQARLRNSFGIGPFSSSGAPAFCADGEDLFNPFLRGSK
ncbi:MAG: glycosyltransferase [Janthinobacterium lividum]